MMGWWIRIESGRESVGLMMLIGSDKPKDVLDEARKLAKELFGEKECSIAINMDDPRERPPREYEEEPV